MKSTVYLVVDSDTVTEGQLANIATGRLASLVEVSSVGVMSLGESEYAVCPCCHERLPMDGEDVPSAHICCGEFTEWQLATMRAGVEERREDAQ